MIDESRKIIRIFLASPGGLEEERGLANRIVGEINSSHAARWGCELELIGWEQTLPGFDRAQSVINRDLDKCQYFVGLMWDHWGSPPEDSDDDYSSGFEEEFERAKGHKESGAMKDIALYFKEIPTDRMRDPGDSLKKVLDFKKAINDARKPLYQEFQNPDGFGVLIRRYLENIGWKESPLLQEFESSSSRSVQPDEDQCEQEIPSSQDGFIEQSASDFLNELLVRPPDWDATSATDVARLRLLGVANSRHGNDEVVLGNHDANLLFGARDRIDFSSKELRGLFESGVAGFGYQNVPLWHWLKRFESAPAQLSDLEFLSWTTDGVIKKNAIRLLQLLNADVPTIGTIDRAQMLSRWVLDQENPDACLAGIDYLRTNGLEEDANFIVENLSTFPNQQKEKAIEAALFILARKGRSEAVELAAKLDPNSVSERAINILFEEPGSLSTNLLKKCITLKSDLIRKCSLSALIERDALDLETLRKFISDNDFSIRRIAIERVVEIGQDLPDSSIRQALIKRAKNQGIFTGLTASLSQIDETEYEQFRKSQLMRMGYDDLLLLYQSASVFDELEVEIFYDRFGKRHKGDLRKHIETGFESYFEKKLDEYAQRIGHDAAQIKKTRSLSEFIRKNLTSSALDNLCKINSKSDVALVRKAIREHELYYSDTVLAYLRRHGSWSDKDAILSFTDKYAAGSSLLHIRSNQRCQGIASALYAISKNRLADLLTLEMQREILGEIFNCLTQKDVRSLGRSLLVRLLNHKYDRARVNLAKKCVIHLTKAELKLLMDEYCAEDRSRYYNVVHWLDLGVAMPRSTVRQVVRSDN